MTISESQKVEDFFNHYFQSEELSEKISNISEINILYTTWYSEINIALLNSAESFLKGMGLPKEKIKKHQVPGAFELPLAVKLLKKDSTALSLVLGCVIKGETPHFDFICQSVLQSLLDLQMEMKHPIALGLLTVASYTQAEQRTSKGREAAQAGLYQYLKLL